MEMIEITDARGTIVRAPWLERAEAVHRALRTALPADYRTKMQRVFAGGGRMVLATEGEAVAGLAVWRVLENTAIGVHLYVDDLVSDEARGINGAVWTVDHGFSATAEGQLQQRVSRFQPSLAACLTIALK